MAIMHLRVYFKYCDSVTQNLAMFGTTVAGPERTSLVEVEGVCVPHAAKVRQPRAVVLNLFMVCACGLPSTDFQQQWPHAHL